MKKVIIVLVFLLFYVSLVNAIDIEECGVLDREGETYVLQNDIETDDTCFRINADDITLDCNGYSITGPGRYGSNGVYAEDVNEITITNCEINGFHRGISLWDSDLNTITNNTANENGYGISIVGSDSNTITDNTANRNYRLDPPYRVPGGFGIYLQASNLNTIINNRIENNEALGIYLWASNSNTITDNTANRNYIGIILEILEDSGSNNNLNSNIFCYNNGSDIISGEGNEFLYNQCDNIGWGEDIECMPCDIESQEIQLNQGWNLISSYLVPYFTDIEAIFGPMARKGELLILKDEEGRFFRPANDFNNIPEWVSTEAYYVKVGRPTTLTIKGEEHTSLEIPLERGWNYIAYPLTEARDMDDIIENVLSPLINNNILNIVKNGRGNFFVPRLNFDNIREMRPGEGYLIKVSEDSVIDFGE